MNTSVEELIDSLPKPIVKHIQHLERMRQDFVANVSHELRTPLTVIHGYLETLLDQEDEKIQAWKKIFLQMQQQTLRMEHLVEDLLLLAHLEKHEEKTKDGEPIVVKNLLTTILNEAKELSGKQKHDFKLQVENNLLIKGREKELRSLFSNIIFNAVKYTPAGGSITISWFTKNNQAYFQVQDTGIGIASEHIPRVTERFYRIDPARSRNSGGTGLGLAIAKHVLIRHQATLNITSKLGHGSTFTCIFPKERILIRP